MKTKASARNGGQTKAKRAPNPLKAPEIAATEKLPGPAASKRRYCYRSADTRARSTEAGRRNLERWRATAEQAPNFEHGIAAFLAGADLPADKQEIIGLADSIIARLGQKLADGNEAQIEPEDEGLLIAARSSLVCVLLGESHIRRAGIVGKRGAPRALLSELGQHTNTLVRAIARLKGVAMPDTPPNPQNNRERWPRTAEGYAAAKASGKFSPETLEAMHDALSSDERYRYLESLVGVGDDIVLSEHADSGSVDADEGAPAMAHEGAVATDQRPQQVASAESSEAPIDPAEIT